jgi:hypothetical protein
MKTNQISPFAALTTFALAAALLGGVVSCKKDEAAPGLSAKIQQIVPPAALDDMKAKGMVINEGNSPPNIEGIFEAAPFTLLAPYGTEDSYAKGRVITNYRYRFSGQNADNVKVDEKQIGGNSSATGLASFLAGSGNKFSLFGQLIGTSAGIPYKQLTVISGEITPTGIKDLQYAFLFTEKTGDASNSSLIPVNKSRVWIDGNQMADKVSVFRKAADDSPATGQPTGSMGGND